MSETPPRVQNADEWDVIFVPSFRHWKTGRIIRAADHGKKAFRIRVRRRKLLTGR